MDEVEEGSVRSPLPPTILAPPPSLTSDDSETNRTSSLLSQNQIQNLSLQEKKSSMTENEISKKPNSPNPQNTSSSSSSSSFDRILPSMIISTILSNLDVRSIYLAAAASRSLRLCASQTLNFLSDFHVIVRALHSFTQIMTEENVKSMHRPILQTTQLQRRRSRKFTEVVIDT